MPSQDMTSSVNLQIARLRDGARMLLRPAAAAAAAADDAALRRLFYTLSDTTRYLYYCVGAPSNEIWAERFVALGHADGCQSYSLVAESTEGVIGVARFDRNPDAQSAEIGIVLADAWQSRGLGQLILRRLAVEARRRGITTLTATTLWENRRMLRLARRVFPELRIAYEYGSCELTMPLATVAPTAATAA